MATIRKRIPPIIGAVYPIAKTLSMARKRKKNPLKRERVVEKLDRDRMVKPIHITKPTWRMSG